MRKWRFDGWSAGYSVYYLMEVDQKILELHEEIRRELLPAACGIYLGYIENGEVRINPRGGGSACAVSTPEGAFFITCAHVLEELREKKHDDDKLFIIGTLNGWMFKLDPVDVHACNKDLDIAVFSAPSAYWFFEPPDDWKARYFKLKFPIVTPAQGETVYLIGYPGEGRQVMQQDHAFLACEVASVSDRHCAFYPDGPRVLTKRGSSLLNENGQLGGASGGPAFVIREDGIHLVGIIKEGGSFQDPIWVSLLKYLKSDGTIDCLAYPQDFNRS